MLNTWSFITTMNSFFTFFINYTVFPCFFLQCNILYATVCNWGMSLKDAKGTTNLNSVYCIMWCQYLSVCSKVCVCTKCRSIRQSQQTCECDRVGVCTELIVLSAWACDKTARAAFTLWFRTEFSYYLKPRSTLRHSHTRITSCQSTGRTFQRGSPRRRTFTFPLRLSFFSDSLLSSPLELERKQIFKELSVL